MKKILLMSALFVHAFYWMDVLIGFNLRLPLYVQAGLGAVFLGSMMMAVIFLRRSFKSSGYHPYLSVTLLSLGLASLGWFLFTGSLALIMGV